MPSEPRLLTSGLFARLQQVRTTAFRLVLCLVGTSLLAYPFAPQILHFLARPLGTKLVMYAPLEGFLSYIAVAFATGFCLTAPYVLYLVYRLLRVVVHLDPKAARRGTLAAGGLFLLGISFCYLIILPVTLRFLLSFGGGNLAPGISVQKYLFMTLGLAGICGVLFELPLVVIILHHLGLLSRHFLVSNRRYAVLVSAILTAMLTPTPDAFTMSALLLPLLALYEVSIVLVRLAERRAQT